jgi:hypothetical protein
VLTTHPLLVPGGEWVETIPPPTPSVLAHAHHGLTFTFTSLNHTR